MKNRRRKRPVKHTVHTRHPRYRVPNYPRGSGFPPVTHNLQASTQTRDIRGEMLAHQASMKKRGIRSTFNRRQVSRVHKRRTLKSQEVDEGLQARVTDNYTLWMKDPNRYDVYGVDYFPVPIKEGDHEWNYKALEESMRDYYGMDDKKNPRPKPIFHTSGETFEKAYGISAVPYAFYSQEKNEIHFSPRATRLMKSGTLSSTENYWVFRSIIHEYEHARGSTRKNTGSAFDEGSTELLASRYAFMALQMKPKLREKLKAETGVAYPYSTHTVGSVALVANGYNEAKAIEWVKELRTATPRKQKSMINKAEKKLIKANLIRDNKKLRDKMIHLQKESDKYWDIARDIQSEKTDSNLSKKLGWYPQDEDGVLGVATGMPIEAALEVQPEKRELAKKWVEYRHKRLKAITQSNDLGQKAGVIEEQLKTNDIFTADHESIDQNSIPYNNLINNVNKVMGEEYTGRWWIDV